MLERLDRCITNSNVVQFTVEVDGEEERFYGIPVGRSRSLFAIHDISDFHFDGYRVARIKDIVRLKSGGFGTVAKRILRSTGELESHASPAWLRLGSWKSLLKCLNDRGYCPTVESALTRADIFSLGEIKDLPTRPLP